MNFQEEILINASANMKFDGVKFVKDPFEITYLVKRYHLDMEKISYNQLLQLVAIISSFDISLIVSIILLIDSFIFKVLIGFICTLIIIIVSYHFVYLFYKKKGMVKNEL